MNIDKIKTMEGDIFDDLRNAFLSYINESRIRSPIEFTMENDNVVMKANLKSLIMNREFVLKFVDTVGQSSYDIICQYEPLYANDKEIAITLMKTGIQSIPKSFNRDLLNDRDVIKEALIHSSEEVLSELIHEYLSMELIKEVILQRPDFSDFFIKKVQELNDKEGQLSDEDFIAI